MAVAVKLILSQFYQSNNIAKICATDTEEIKSFSLLWKYQADKSQIAQREVNGKDFNFLW